MSDFTEIDGSVLERLALCAVEIDGIKAGYPLATVGAKYSTPYFYGKMGAMRRVVVTESSDKRRWQRTYIWRLVVKNLHDGINTLEGDEATLDAIPYVTTVHNYIHQHPRLHTETLAGLTNIMWIQSEDAGMVDRQVTTGVRGLCIDFSLVVQFEKRLEPLPEPIV